MILNRYYILDNYWSIDRFFPFVKIGISGNALVSLLYLLVIFLLLLYIVYIIGFFIDIKVLTGKNKVYINMGWYYIVDISRK